MADKKEIDLQMVGDILVGQSVEFEVGGRKLVIRPRTLSQLLMISKKIVGYNDSLYQGIKELEKVSKADQEKELEKFMAMPIEHIVKMLQMFLDGGKKFDKNNPEVEAEFLLNAVNFSEIKAMVDAVLAMHNIGDVLKNLNGLRIN